MSQTVDAYGNVVPDTQRLYVQTALSGRQTLGENANYNSASAAVSAAEPAPQYRPRNDNIVGSAMYRTIGHSIMPVRIIWQSPITLKETPEWVQHVVTFAGGICAPIDETEEGIVTGFSLGAKIVYEQETGLIVPTGMDPFLVSAMQYAIDHMIIYPGNEIQKPDPTIVFYEGVNAVNAYRAYRYILVKDWPIKIKPKLMIKWKRTSKIKGKIKTKPPKKPPGKRPVKVTGDYSCYTTKSYETWVEIPAEPVTEVETETTWETVLETVEGSQLVERWTLPSAVTFTPNGDIWAGTAGIDIYGNQVFVMAGDGPADVP